MELNDNSLMPWGKHKGDKMANIPAYYLIWLYDSGKCYSDVLRYIQDNLDDLRQEVENNRKS